MPSTRHVYLALVAGLAAAAPLAAAPEPTGGAKAPEGAVKEGPMPVAATFPSTTKHDGLAIDEARAETIAGTDVRAWGNCSVYETSTGLPTTTYGSRHACIAIVTEAGRTMTTRLVSDVTCGAHDTGCQGGYLVDLEIVSVRDSEALEGYTESYVTTYRQRNPRTKKGATGKLTMRMTEELAIALADGRLSKVHLVRRDAGGGVVGTVETSVLASTADEGAASSYQDCYVRAQSAGDAAREPWDRMAETASTNYKAYLQIMATNPELVQVMASSEMRTMETARYNARIEAVRAIVGAEQQCKQNLMLANFDPDPPKGPKSPGQSSSSESNCPSASGTSTVKSSYTEEDGTHYECETEVTTECGTTADGSCGCQSSAGQTACVGV